jgi:hypothetical protein
MLSVPADVGTGRDMSILLVTFCMYSRVALALWLAVLWLLCQYRYNTITTSLKTK